MDCPSCGLRNRRDATTCSGCGAALGATIASISAVSLATADMARAVRFYRELGFQVRSGGEDASFTSFMLDDGYLNLSAQPATGSRPFWGRLIFYVSDVDALHARALALGLHPVAPPRDASWGERYFHLVDPDGHELSFARPLAPDERSTDGPSSGG